MLSIDPRSAMSSWLRPYLQVGPILHLFLLLNKLPVDHSMDALLQLHLFFAVGLRFLREGTIIRFLTSFLLTSFLHLKESSILDFVSLVSVLDAVFSFHELLMSSLRDFSDLPRKNSTSLLSPSDFLSFAKQRAQCLSLYYS